MERVIFYLDNGNEYMGDQYTQRQAIKILKEKGYKVAFTGRKFTVNGQRTIVGINENNTVDLVGRRKNGLVNARTKTIK